MSEGQWTVGELVEDLKAGRVNRRQFVRTLLGVGVGMPMIAGLIAACGGDSDDAPSSGATTGATQPPSAVGAQTSVPQSQQAAFNPTRRGGGGQLKLFWWQAPSILNPHQSSGTKDRDGSRIFLEPLAAIDADGAIVPILAAEVPSQQNGGIEGAVSSTVTWKLKRGVTWHDGRPFTADDVVFTYQYVVDPATAALTIGTYRDVEKVDKIDDYTVKITFKQPTLEWSAPFTSTAGMILPKHIHEQYKGAEAKNAPANLKPVGTGPYKFVEFRPNDLVLAEINNSYHVENRPFFDRLEMKGGGDAVGAARAVLQTGEYDYAWNLQIDAQTLNSLAKDSAQGTLLIDPGSGIEHLNINWTDPNIETDGERSSVKNPHPFFTDKKVRQALSLAVNRKLIVEQLYGPAGAVANYYVYTPAKYVGTTQYEYNLAKANTLLDEAGWRKGGDGVRVKDGKRMKVLYSTSVNKLRQDTQAVIKKDLESIGFEVELKSVDQSIFFGADPANPDNFPHFYADLQMYTATRGGPDDLISAVYKSFLTSEIAQKANSWSLANSRRYTNKDFDAMYDRVKAEKDPTKIVDTLKQMNQMLVDDVAVVPIVARNDVGATKKNLKGFGSTPWDGDLWRLAYWYREG